MLRNGPVAVLGFVACMAVLTLPLRAAAAEDEKKADGAVPKPAPVPNPLQNLFQRLLQPTPPPPAQRVVPQMPQRGVGGAGPAAKPLDPNARDHIDARAPKDRKQSEALRKAQAAADSGDWPGALELLQNILAQEEDSIDRFEKDGWDSVRSRAIRLLLKLPDEVARAFRQRWEAEAKRKLDESERSGQNRFGQDSFGTSEQIARLATRFLWTEAGQTALDRLASRQVNRGEFRAATRWFRLLADANSVLTTARTWQLKAAMAAKLAGQQELAEKWLKGDGSRGDDETLELHGERIQVREWWNSLSPQRVVTTSLNDWPMFFGAPNRAGTSAGGEPLLLPRWQQPQTLIQPLQRQLEILVEECQDQNRATLPVAHPLLVNGLVAVRTLSGIQVFDLKDGRPLWTSSERWPAETLIGSGNGPIGSQAVVNGVPVAMPNRFNTNFEFNGQPIDNHPLSQLLFANGNFGPLSSDGRQLFGVEDETVVTPTYGYWGGGDMSRNDPLRRSWLSNKLVSYDLRSGRTLWTVGGQESTEAFQPRLPGVFFIGAPTPDGNDLFIVGERDSEIRLFCLDIQTGDLRWTQLLATAETAISRDLARRWVTAQVALSDGVLVCPTGVGWLVGVDRASRQLLWVHRYSKPQAGPARRVSNQALTVLQPFGQRWAASAPVIVGESIVFTPHEPSEELNTGSQHVVCLNLHTGERRWEQPRNNWLALNGVTNGKVLLMGQNAAGTQFDALSLETGKSVWNTTVQNQRTALAGLGVITSDKWHIPFTQGGVLTLSLLDGKKISQQWPPQEMRLGNLAMHQGSLVSVHATGVSCFEQREEIEADIQRRKTKDPLDATALLTEAALLKVERKHDAALKVLASLNDESLSPDLSARHRPLRRELLIAHIESRPTNLTDELQQLERLIDSPTDRLTWQRLKIEDLFKRREYTAAADVMLEMSHGDMSQTMLVPGNAQRAVRLDAWLAGRLTDLWQATPKESRNELTAKVQPEVERLRAGTPAERRRAAEVFSFHASTLGLRAGDADEWLKQGDFARGELALLRLSDLDIPKVAALTWRRLVQLYSGRGLNEDATQAASRLKQFGDVELASGVSAARWVEQQFGEGDATPKSSVALPNWGALSFRLERAPGYFNYSEQTHDCVISDARWPFFANHRFQYQVSNNTISTQRLTMAGWDDNQLDWSVPLRQKVTSQLNWSVATRSVGHELLVFHREVLHLVSPVDQRVVWTRPVDVRAASFVDASQQNRRLATPFVTGNEFANRPVDSGEDMLRNGLLPLCSPTVVAYRGRRMLTVVDTATGEWRWELRDLPTDARILATRHFLFIIATRWPTGLLLRAIDGQTLSVNDSVREKFQRAKQAIDQDLLLTQITLVDGKNQLVVERWSPQRGETVWKNLFPTNALFVWLDSRTLATISPEHQLSSLDLESGEQVVLGKLEPADVAGNRRRYAIADRDRVFYVSSGTTNQNNSDDQSALPASGTVYAFQRRAGGEIWRQEVRDQNMSVQQFGISPVLVFSVRQNQNRNFGFVQPTSLLLLDKNTGRKLYEGNVLQQFSSFRGLQVNLPERTLELLMHNERIRIIGSDPPAKEAAKAEPAAKPNDESTIKPQ